MPELKRLFLKGRMNKDLDERLVPNGEYRDALNIQIGSSEGSDVGAIENILGNTVGNKKRQGPLQYWELDSASTNYYGLPKDAKCIGGVKDDINDRIYWFVHSSEVDCIIEYDNQYGVVRPVLVDDFTTNGTRILNFEFNKLITGVNILDNYLFFTDDNSEPKKVDVSKYVFNSPDFTTHSTYKGRGFIESDITVIKKSPLSAPSITLFNSDRNIDGITNINCSITLNLTTTLLYNGSLGAAKSVGTQLLYVNLSTACAYKIGDFLELTGAPISAAAEVDEYKVVLQILEIHNPISIDAEIISIDSFQPDEYTTYACELQQDTPPFELVFPRFAYRWKYEDNQYSKFSPFTEVAFLPKSFEYNSKNGYNEGMVNQARKIVINNLETPPVDVEKIEILYKETNNPSVYIVTDITPDDLNNIRYNGVTVTSNLIYKLIESNQLLRVYDNVPRLAKAQEIIGNRLIYGNYLQNYNISEDIKLKTRIKSFPIAAGEPAEYSLKSDRDYQVGVVLIDKYGRETPVFTSDEASIKIPKTAAKLKNTLKAQLTSEAPDGFEYYKYYIKDSYAPYYNLTVDRAFKTERGRNLWLGIPSPERNKITEESYLLFKKSNDSQQPINITNNKYKILAIEDTPPKEITDKKVIQQDTAISFMATFGSTLLADEKTTKGGGQTPVNGSKTFLIGRENGNAGITDQTKEVLIPGNFIKFVDNITTGAASRYYEIANVAWATGVNSGRVYVTEPFNDDIAFLYNTDGTTTPTLVDPDGNNIEIYKVVDDSDNSKFDGKFFASIESRSLISEEFITEENLVVADSFICKSWGNTTLTGDEVDAPLSFPWGGMVPAENLYVHMWGGGHSPKRGYNYAAYDGGLDQIDGYDFYEYAAPTWADDDATDIIYDLAISRMFYPSVPAPPYWSRLTSPGQKIKFGNHPDAIYTIENTRTLANFSYAEATWGNAFGFQRIYIKLDRDLEQTVNPNFFNDGGYSQINIIFLDAEESDDVITNNPAIFETEPDKLPDLNIYYEASEAYPIADWQNVKTLNWSNCFSFGNGVESDRIRDDYNAPYIDKGAKASSVLDDIYKEERRSTGLIYSGIYNSNSGVNNLNQFIQAEEITKDLNPIYGSIQKLHTRDTNLVAFCEDKVLRILANKDALYNADGNVNVTSTNNVLGQAVPFAGEFGISKNPESFASYGFRAYFSDKKRGAMLRLSIDGLTEISNKGMNDYFWNNLKNATTVIGNYDVYSDCYTVTLNNDTVCFDEKTDGWPTRKSFIPEFGISLNAEYYTMSNGMIWKHNNESRNTFYEEATEKSSVQLIFNDNPSKIKNFKTLSYEGDSGWTAPLIQTDQQNGSVETFLDKENIYYNYIKGEADSWSNFTQSGTLDLKQFAAQGIGNPSSIDPYTGNTTFKIVVKNDPADAETTYTVTEYTVEAEVGEQVNLNVTEFALYITPEDGYNINAASLTIPLLPSEINTAVFTDEPGGAVKLTCTFDSSFIMPSSDVTILLDIDGVAGLVSYTIDGQYTISQSNTQESAVTPVAFSQTGDIGDTVTLFTKTFTATSGYYYATPPYFYESTGASRSTSGYIITRSDTGVGATPEETIITSTTFTVKYLIQSGSETLNDINFVADAVEIFTPTTEVNSYSISLAKFPILGTNRQITFYGDPGAEVTFATTEPYPVDSWVAANNDQTLTLNDAGEATMTIIVPENTTGSNQTWTFTLSGADLASPFTQDNPFTIIQLG